MYLRRTATYYRGSTQHAARAPFLLLLQPERATIADTCTAANTYACVRLVALEQCGHYMMGRARLGGTHWHTLSGAYGNDGMPKSVRSLPRDAVPLPAHLYAAWSNGGGHNSCGAEADAMRAWALATFPRKR
jgi:hypothetical protein